MHNRMEEADYGDGIFRRKYKKADGTIVKSKYWTIKFSRDGKPYQKTLRTTSRSEADAKPEDRGGWGCRGAESRHLAFEKVTYDQLAEDLVRDYRTNQRKSMERLNASLKRLGELLLWDAGHQGHHDGDSQVHR